MLKLYNTDYKLDSPEEIEDYFHDCGRDLFETDTYKYATEAYTTIKIGDKYFEVMVEVTMVGEKRDYGDKLYNVESIDQVTYTEIPYAVLKANFNDKIESLIKVKEDEIHTLCDLIL